LREPVKILPNEGMECDGALGNIVGIAFGIDLIGTGCERFRRDFTDDFEHLSVIIDHIVKPIGEIICIAVGRFPLLNGSDFLKIEVIKQKLNVLIVSKIVRHLSVEWFK
jgi:hypothetical protein